MHLSRVIVENFKVLEAVDLSLNPGMNLVVGNNDTGKSTLLEAINLCLTGYLHARPVGYEITPYLFNRSAVKAYLHALTKGEPEPPPRILIECYFENSPELAKLKGTNNSKGVDCPGLTVRIELDEAFQSEYKEYIADASRVREVPAEMYCVRWFAFTNNTVNPRAIPIKSIIIDTSVSKPAAGADRYISTIIDGALTAKEKANLALDYREIKEKFSSLSGIKSLNESIEKQKGEITDRSMVVSLDMTSRATWESGLIPYLDDIPFSNSGKGEQSSVKMKLAMHSAKMTHLFLIEEPENHLSFSNMHSLIERVAALAKGKQIVIATHSSFVANKLGLNDLVLFTGTEAVKLDGLSRETFEYFKKLPGYDTLRIILSKKAILVEGPSDELIVQRAYLDAHGKLPVEDGVDVISVRGVSFKRFLDIAKLLNLDVKVVTDNDGDAAGLVKRYEGYLDYLCYSDNDSLPTLEPQIVNANSVTLLNRIFGTSFADQAALISYMTKSYNKTDCALKIFTHAEKIAYPSYICDAIKK